MNKIPENILQDNEYELKKKIKSRISQEVYKRMEETNQVGKFTYDQVYEICAGEFIKVLKSMSPYCFNQAIEYARQTSIEGGWRNNRERLGFYKRFADYLPEWLKKKGLLK